MTPSTKSIALEHARRLWNGGTAIITGAGSGIGAGLARVAGGLGMTVVLADLSDDRMDAVSADVIAAGGTARRVATDVTDLASVEHLAAVAFDEIGDVRLVANNAGVEHVGLLWEESPEAWHRVIDVNVNGVYHGIRVFVPRLIDAASQSHVLNIASVGALSVGAYHGIYQVSKHAVLALSECLASDLAAVQAPVQVSVALPGPVNTRIFTDSNAETAGGAAVDEQVDQMRAMLVEQGMSGDEAAQMLLSQVAEGRFWVTTHPEWFQRSANRRAEHLGDAARTFPVADRQTEAAH